MSRLVAGGTRTRRDRRGATIVLVAILMVALVGMTAFAVDVSRMYVGANELQTVADASALRGAQRLQSNPGVDPSSEIIAYSLANEAMNGTVAAQDIVVEAATWTESSATLTTGVGWANANAVQVTARKTAGLLFGRVLRSAAPVPARRGAAWIANLNSSECTKPIAMNMTRIMSLAGATSLPLTQAQVNSLSALSQAARTMIVYPPQANNNNPNPGPDGRYAALRLGGNGNSAYRNNWTSTACDADDSLSVGAARSKPGGNGNLGRETEEGLYASYCFADLVFVDTCYADAARTRVGVSILASFGTAPGVFGASNSDVTISMLGKFVIMCVKTVDNGPAGTCDYAGFTDMSTMPEGTIIGYADPDFAELGTGTRLGNITSTAQRLILVK